MEEFSYKAVATCYKTNGRNEQQKHQLFLNSLFFISHFREKGIKIYFFLKNILFQLY